MTNEMLLSQACTWAAAIGRGERTRAGTSALLYLSVETAVKWTSGVGNI